MDGVTKAKDESYHQQLYNQEDHILKGLIQKSSTLTKAIIFRCSYTTRHLRWFGKADVRFAVSSSQFEDDRTKMSRERERERERERVGRL